MEQPDGAFVGGYLLLTSLGRPLEFHCTAPVIASRPQQILYGPTLRPYLIGEQMTFALLNKSTLSPAWICTDERSVLAVRPLITTPVALISTPDAELSKSTEVSRAYRLDAGHETPPPGHDFLSAFTVSGSALAVEHRFADDRHTIVQRWQPHAGKIDLTEPFVRIREALAEAQRGGK